MPQIRQHFILKLIIFSFTTRSLPLYMYELNLNTQRDASRAYIALSWHTPRFSLSTLFVGCEKFVSIDGIWKLRHLHCLYPVKAAVAGLPTINYPNVCTEEPETQASAFWAKHSQLAKEKTSQPNLKELIHNYCKVARNHDGIYALIHSIYDVTLVYSICMIHDPVL